MTKLKMQTPDLTLQNIEKIAELFPNCITETVDENGQPKRAVNFPMLKQMLSGEVLDGDEAYEFTWVGKKASIVEANRPIRKTLRPCIEESRNWNETENLYIEGDNLEVLKQLQESYLGKVKMIYIDPPYNTGNDFIYRDDFRQSAAEYDEESGVFDEDENRLFKNTDSNGRFHSDWCSMIYPRLMLARNLLSDDGVIFVSIGQAEQYNIEKICDEIFGEDNRVGVISRLMKSGGGKGQFFSPNIDYIMVYSKNISNLPKFRVPTSEKTLKSYYKNVESDGVRKGQLYGEERIYVAGLDARPNQRYWIECPDGSFVIPPIGEIPCVLKEGEKVTPKNGDGCWKWTYETYREQKQQNNIVFKMTNTSALVDENGNQSKYNLYNKVWLNNKEGSVPGDFIAEYENRQSSKELKGLDIPFDFAKPKKLLMYLFEFIDIRNAIILDFFSGSATTAHAVMQLNAEDGGKRKFIMVQLPEPCDEKSEAYKAGYKNICEIGKERIRRAGDKIKAETGADIDYGFRVFKVDDSNMNDIYYSVAELSQTTLASTLDNIKPDRSALDLLFGCLLDWGLPLSMSYKSEQLGGCTVHTYNEGDLLACFDMDIPEEVLVELAKRQPLRAVFRDSCFADSPAKINVFEIFKLYAPDCTVKVL